MTDTPPWRPELLAALTLLARVSEALHRRGLPRPILVGGGAAEYFSGSALMTGDIDLTSPVQPEVEAELTRLGFTKPEGLGHTPLGWVHPDLGLGFEIVASTPMGGTIDHARIRLVRPPDETATFRVIAVEDLIADRMGQLASGTAPEMVAQAAILFALYPDLDRAYLDRHIREESSGDYGIDDVSTAEQQPVIDMAEFGRDLARRREAAGNPEMPRNAGNRRTPSKRALLDAIEKAGGTW